MHLKLVHGLAPVERSRDERALGHPIFVPHLLGALPSICKAMRKASACKPRIVLADMQKWLEMLCADMLAVVFRKGGGTVMKVRVS